MSQYDIYYGEYTLDSWIKMILSREIELPPYQRDFVWSEEKVVQLLNSLKKGDFVPPITVGTYIDDKGVPHHYVLDGQQRLSAILLGKLGIFPQGKKFFETGRILANNNDDESDDDSEEIGYNNVRAWKFSFVHFGEKGVINAKQDNENYKKLENIENLELTDDFWKDNCIGFSYIKPGVELSGEKQKRYFSTLFRNINTTAVSLSDMESRASLYWLDENWKNFFQPQGMLSSIEIKNGFLDFARIAAVLAQYKKEGSSKGLAQGYSRRSRYSTGKDFETYIEDFIYETVGEKESKIFKNLNELYPKKGEDFLPLLKKTDDYYKSIGFPEKYDSIIYSDLVLFGLVYFILFERKELDLNKKNQLLLDVKKEFSDSTEAHKKSPAALSWLRKRVDKSLRLYAKYVK